MRGVGLLVLAAALAVEAMPASVTAQTVRHSGTVVAMDTERGRLVLDEIGPWRVRGGVTQVRRLAIVFTPATDFLIALRANPPDGFLGQFIEGRLEAADVEVGIT